MAYCLIMCSCAILMHHFLPTIIRWIRTYVYACGTRCLSEPLKAPRPAEWFSISLAFSVSGRGPVGQGRLVPLLSPSSDLYPDIYWLDWGVTLPETLLEQTFFAKITFAREDRVNLSSVCGPQNAKSTSHVRSWPSISLYRASGRISR